jgi:hypothetical protein
MYHMVLVILIRDAIPVVFKNLVPLVVVPIIYIVSLFIEMLEVVVGDVVIVIIVPTGNGVTAFAGIVTFAFDAK